MDGSVTLLSGSSSNSEFNQTAIRLFKDIETNANAFANFVESTVAKIKSSQLQTSNGLSFLELKNLTMLSYLIDLTYVIYRKCDGQSISGDKAIERLVEMRTTLEKMKPINYKLKYRIDKMVRAANAGTLNLSDPLNMRPKPEDMLDDKDSGSEREQSESESDRDEDGSAEKSVEKEKAKKEGVYRPPKVVAMHYDDDEDAQSRKQKALDNAKRRAFSTSVIQELRSEFDEAPEEIAESSVGRRRLNKQAKERERYEEEYMVRLNVPKKQQARENKQNLLTMSALSHDLTRFENLSVLDRDSVGEGTSSSSGRKRKSGGGKGRKSFGGKRKKFKKFKKRS